MTDKNQTLEREPAHWNQIVGSAQDKEDLQRIDKENSPLEMSGEYYDRQPGSGMILRRGNLPIGYILYRIENHRDRGRVLHISLLQIAKAQRGAGVINKLIRALQQHCKKEHIDGVVWFQGIDMVQSLGQRIGSKDNTPDDNMFFISTEQLDVPTLTRLSKISREQNRDTERS